jgi:hypothetical protein
VPEQGIDGEADFQGLSGPDDREHIPFLVGICLIRKQPGAKFAGRHADEMR